MEGEGLPLPPRVHEARGLLLHEEARDPLPDHAAAIRQPRQPRRLAERGGALARRPGGGARDRGLPRVRRREAALRRGARGGRADPGPGRRARRQPQGGLRARAADPRALRRARRGAARLVHQGAAREVPGAERPDPAGLRHRHQGDLEDQAGEPRAGARVPHARRAGRAGSVRRRVVLRHEGPPGVDRVRDRARRGEPLQRPARQHAALEASPLRAPDPGGGRGGALRRQDDPRRGALQPAAPVPRGGAAGRRLGELLQRRAPEGRAHGDEERDDRRRGPARRAREGRLLRRHAARRAGDLRAELGVPGAPHRPQLPRRLEVGARDASLARLGAAAAVLPEHRRDDGDRRARARAA